MRLGLVVIALAACSCAALASASGRGPAWPKPRVSEVDGGESLAPRAAARAIAAIAEDDRPADKAAVDKPVPAPAAGSAGSAVDKPAAGLSALPASDDPITTEEIVIEIED
jgi:hypothetical protein